MAAGAGRADETAFEAAPQPARTAAIVVEPHVLVDNGASRGHTVIEVSARDRPGLLYDITRTLSVCGVSINSAHISTVGSRAVDVFYVKDRFGLRLSRDAQIAQVRDRLTEMLERGSGVAPDRRADETAPDRRADETAPDRRADETAPDRRADETTPDRRADDPAPRRRAAV